MICFILFFSISSLAADSKKGGAGNESKKVIRFDEEIVDGMDKARLDSLMSKVNKRDGNGDHLYRVRKNFRKENQQVIKEFIFTP